MTKEQDTPKPKTFSIPEDCISLGGYENDALACVTSRTDNTDADACSPYSAKLIPYANESGSDMVAAFTSRTDDTDDGSPGPRKAPHLQRCSTRDLVDIVDQRTQQVEQLLQVGSALVTEKRSSCQADSPAHKDSLHGCEWENLHDEANAHLADLHNRLITMAREPACSDDETTSGDSNLADEVHELRNVVSALRKELSEVKQGEAGLREEASMLRERLSRVDRQAAWASGEVAELRKADELRKEYELHKLYAASLSMRIESASQKEVQEAEKPTVPKLRIQAPTAQAPTNKPKVPPLNLSPTGTSSKQPSKQLAGSHARIHPRRLSQSTQPSRPFMGQNFFRK